ncbi:MAG TPA: extracellular solute-binding protein [Candidatus Omnitrophota bacterium]|jgi:ABC-type glycerol-3-phosphate transport system substrate-binding protein|nr:extracellular solute-binding protein [Candidatus Omnitrophota bacterium]HPN56317.1 extracellular solute-binding protein [Candidatus Omnitrophota bacterium]
MKGKLLLVIGFCALATIIWSCQSCGPAVPPNKNMITVWHWMTDRHDAFNELAKRYQAETGVEVVFELYAPSDVYSQKIIAAAQAHILPDIFGILDKKAVFATFIESGFIANLTEEFQKDEAAWEKSLFPKALSANRFEEGNVYNIKPGIYGVPIDVTNIQMLYNKKLLEKAGVVRAPQTFDEFLAATEALNRVGVSGLVSGWGELWMADCFASNYAFNIMGEDKVMNTFRGKVPYTDPEWIEVFRIFDILRQKGALVEGIVTKANKYAEQDFALGRAAFAFNGSWCVNVYHEMNPDLEYGIILPPKYNTSLPMRIWGGAGSSFVVNSASEKQDKAVAFLKWLSAKEQQAYLSQETLNLPANRYALTDIPAVLSEFARAMDATTHPTIWPLNEEPLVIEAFDKGIQSIIIGEKTPEQVAQDVQNVKEREMAKKQKRK